MNVWYNLSTIFRQRLTLWLTGLFVLCVALITTLFFSIPTHAVANVTQTVAFQGRILDANNNVVPDGYYNIQFKIYEGGTGTTAGNPNGTLKWTETYINNGGNNGVYIKNGYFSVSLGSKNTFGTSIDWTKSTLWLSVNVAGSATSCSTFGSGACSADGEMLPMKQINATPLAINSEQVGGKNSSQLVQLGQGTQQDNTNESSVAINKTGTGNFLTLQNNAVDTFSITGNGDIVLGGSTAQSIGIGTSSTNISGGQLTINAGNGGGGLGTDGGDLILVSGDAGGDNGNGGNITLDTGSATGTGNGGNISIGTQNAQSITIGGNTSGTQTINIGVANSAGSTTNVVIGSDSSADGGSTTIQGKDGVSIATNGTTRVTVDDTSMYLGNGSISDAPSDFTIQGTNSSGSTNSGGSINIQGGNATIGDMNGGNITLNGGSGSGSGADGLVIISTPTFAATTNDANCYTNGSLVASNCTISTSSINSTAVVVLGFSEAGRVATLPDPTLITAGRILYITAAEDSSDFTLSINGGGNGNELSLRANSAATLLWNGSDWVSAGSTSATALQDSLTAGSGSTNIQIGNGQADSNVTLLTLDKSASAPTATNSEALLGSIYYDTTLGEIQCYEADGWGDCGSTPDNFVSLSPEYSNAVTNGSTKGTLETDLCSDTLNINDGSNSQPTICGENETYNFYNWSSTEETEQQKSIYVNYQLPSTFSKFASDLTSLKARTDSDDASVSYQLYRNTSGDSLVTCGDTMTVSTGVQTSWQTKTASGASDPANCNFKAGDTVVIKITLSSKNGANAYVSNLNFTYGNE